MAWSIISKNTVQDIPLPFATHGNRRFWTKVKPDPITGCWIWTSSIDQSGYGRFYVEGRNCLAHRWAYAQLVGSVAAGLLLDHLCRVRSCVNPRHLEPVSSRDNTLRSSETLAAQQLARTQCPRGHAYDAANTRLYKGRRNCRACEHARSERRAKLCSAAVQTGGAS